MSNGKNELLFHKNVVCVIIMKGLGNEIMRHYPLQFISKKLGVFSFLKIVGSTIYHKQTSSVKQK